MGLDIGVIPEIVYLDRPDHDVYDFAWHLNINADEADWIVSSDGHTIAEYTRETMSRQIEEYIANETLVRDGIDRIHKWVDDLPWRNGVIMLHYSW